MSKVIIPQNIRDTFVEDRMQMRVKAILEAPNGRKIAEEVTKAIMGSIHLKELNEVEPPKDTQIVVQSGCSPLQQFECKYIGKAKHDASEVNMGSCEVFQFAVNNDKDVDSLAGAVGEGCEETAMTDLLAHSGILLQLPVLETLPRKELQLAYKMRNKVAGMGEDCWILTDVYVQILDDIMEKHGITIADEDDKPSVH